MPSHHKARQFAKKFAAAYPETLADRLEWWRTTLGISRARLLRMMGLSADEAERKKATNWSDLLKNKEWEENAWWVEGKLHDLLALFDFDWQSLSDRLHHGVATGRQEPSRVSRQRGDITRLQYVPSNDGADALLNQLARGGPESFSALISYLARERSS